MSFIYIILGYLIGSIPFGFLIYKLKSGRDIRESGSGATGATNVARHLGLTAAAIVTVLDILKGFVAVLIAKMFAPEIVWLQPAVAFAAIVGHCFPVWIGFRGGKGVNTALGSTILLSWQALVAAIFVFAIAFLVTKIVSISSLSAVCAFSIAILVFGRFIESSNTALEAFAIGLPAIIIFTHRKNIERIFRGEEKTPTRTA